MLSRLAYRSKQKVTLRRWKDFGGFIVGARETRPYDWILICECRACLT